MPRLAKRTDELSDAAWRVMVEGFAKGRSAEYIAQAVMDEAGEEISARTVARRASEWRGERDRRKLARERMEDLVAALKTGDGSAAEMVQALAMETLRENPDALTTADPVRLARVGLASEELRLKRRKLDLDERKVATLETRVRLLQEREERALAALSGEGAEKLTDEERVRRIKEIYGLAA